MTIQFKGINKLNQAIHHLALMLLGISEVEFLQLSEEDQIAHYEAVSEMVFGNANVFSRIHNENLTAAQKLAWSMISNTRTSTTQSEEGVIKAFTDHVLRQLSRDSLTTNVPSSNQKRGI